LQFTQLYERNTDGGKKLQILQPKEAKLWVFNSKLMVKWWWIGKAVTRARLALAPNRMELRPMLETRQRGNRVVGTNETLCTW